MNPEVTAAIIAASVSFLTLIGTVIAQIIGFRSTKASTEEQIKATHTDTANTLRQQREQVDRTLTEQHEQLDKTLKAQSEQLKQTLAEQRTRTLNERFATAADELGSDKPTVRLAGVYAMAGLADDWPENRQTCVEVLCAYLRMPYEPDPGQDAPEAQRLAFQAIREVRHTVIRVITAHLQDAAVSWQGLNFDFTGVVFDGGDFGGARFSGGTVGFAGASSPAAGRLHRAEFSGGTVDFSYAGFSGGRVNFIGAQFSGGTVDFKHPVLRQPGRLPQRRVLRRQRQLRRRPVLRRHGRLQLRRVLRRQRQLRRRRVLRRHGQLLPRRVLRRRGQLRRRPVLRQRRLRDARFSGGSVNFGGARFSGGSVYFGDAQFSGGTVDFGDAWFSGGEVSFGGVRFSGGTVDFSRAEFSGGTVGFAGARFSGGSGQLQRRPVLRRHGRLQRCSRLVIPPAFPWTDTPPPGVKLPELT